MTTENTEKNNAVKNVNEILNLMNRVNETFAYEIWIPSLQKEVMFREINTSQQKRLIKSVIDSPIYNTEFIFAITQIIKENCIEDIIVDDLTILDKLFICLKMRSVSISDTFEIEFEKFGKQHKRGLSLIKVYDDAKNVIDLSALEAKTFSDSVYSVSCCIPTIKTEFSLEKELRNKVEDINVQSPDEVRNMIGEMYITEIIKFISELSIKSEDEEIQIPFNDQITFKNRIAIIERLPAKLIEQLIKYISQVKKELEKVVLIKTSAIDEEGIKQDIEEVLTIDGNFFINS